MTASLKSDYRQMVDFGLSAMEEVYYIGRHFLDTSVGVTSGLLYDSAYRRRRLAAYRGQRHLLVMVTGYMQHPHSFKHLEQHLGQERFDVFTYTWGDFPYSQDITLSAQQLAEALREAHGLAPAPEILLLGHSQGGIIIRAMVQHGLADDLPIRKCLFLSSPHQGTWAGLAALPHRGLLRLVGLVPYMRKVTGESGLQLLPGSDFLRQLNALPLPEHIQFSSVFYALDPMIWPPANAILPYPEARNHFVLKVGHAHPLYCARAAAIAIEEFFGESGGDSSTTASPDH